MSPVPVSIIIPNYNGELILRKNLRSVVEAADAYPGESETIVVDDASEDDSIKIIDENFSDVKIVRHDINKGFSGAVHSGVDSSVHPIIILLNADVRPDREFIAPLVCWFNRDDTFAVSPLIVDYRERPARVSWNLVKMRRGEVRKRNWDLEDARRLIGQGRALRSLYASGGSVAIRKEMFLQLGGFLSLYKPFYYEDCDLCTRAWQQGWKTYFEPQSRVVHDHEGTIKRFYAKKKIKVIRRRNRFFYLWLHLSTAKIFFSHIPWIFVRLLLRLLRMDFVYAVALVHALFRLGEVVEVRSQLNRPKETQSLERIIKDIRES